MMIVCLRPKDGNKIQFSQPYNLCFSLGIRIAVAAIVTAALVYSLPARTAEASQMTAGQTIQPAPDMLAYCTGRPVKVYKIQKDGRLKPVAVPIPTVTLLTKAYTTNSAHGYNAVTAMGSETIPLAAHSLYLAPGGNALFAFPLVPDESPFSGDQHPVARRMDGFRRLPGGGLVETEPDCLPDGTYSLAWMRRGSLAYALRQEESGAMQMNSTFHLDYYQRRLLSNQP